MAEVLFLNDLHIGYSGSAQIYQDEIVKFFDDVLFPYIESNKIIAIIIAGDFFDNRREINVKAANYVAREKFLDRIPEHIKVYMTIGNHDTYFRNKIQPNSISQFAYEYDNVVVCEKPMEIHLQDLTGEEEKTVSFLALPWICEATRDEVKKAIEESKLRYCVAHLELAGFLMESGQIAKKGTDPDVFKKFNKVFTGHFHTMSQKDNILYMGTQYQMTRADDGLVKGFYSMDLQTEELKRITNPSSLFITIKIESDKIEGLDAFEYVASHSKEYEGKILTLIFDKNCTKEMAEKVCRDIEQSGAYDYKIIDSLSRAVEDNTLDQEISVSDTMTMMKKHVDESDVYKDLDRDIMKKLLEEIHHEAING